MCARALYVLKTHTLKIEDDGKMCVITIEFTPTVPHCSLATLIGLCLREKLRRELPRDAKVWFHCPLPCICLIPRFSLNDLTHTHTHTHTRTRSLSLAYKSIVLEAKTQTKVSLQQTCKNFVTIRKFLQHYLIWVHNATQASQQDIHFLLLVIAMSVWYFLCHSCGSVFAGLCDHAMYHLFPALFTSL